MINCPNCGTPVQETAKFCGNCGVDVQATLAAQAQAMAAQSAVYQPPQVQPIQQAYPLQTTPYGGYGINREDPSPMRARLLIAAVLVIAVACAFCCGVLTMVAFYELSTPVKPTPTPTRQSLEFLQLLLQFIV